MPDYRIRWSRPNPPIAGEPQDDSSVTTQLRATTPEKAVARALESVLSPNEIEGMGEPEVLELDEDGEPV